MATLAYLVQGLPAELYNKVLEFTLTFPKKICINKDMFDYESPAQLQISRATRARAMGNMVNNTIFWTDDENECDLARWMASLDHLDRLPIVHYEGKPPFQRRPIAPRNARDEAKKVFVNLLLKMIVCDKWPDAQSQSQKQKYDRCVNVRDQSNGVSRWMLDRAL